MHTVGLPGEKAGLSQENPTLARLPKAEGYVTGQFGKNHLGDLNEFLPTSLGFDEYWGWWYHLNAMEYTSDPDWPDYAQPNALYGPRKIVHSYATAEDQGVKVFPYSKNRNSKGMRSPPYKVRMILKPLLRK
jgi:arylsulfatase